jgi:hypothetical protein
MGELGVGSVPSGCAVHLDQAARRGQASARRELRLYLILALLLTAEKVPRDFSCTATLGRADLTAEIAPGDIPSLLCLLLSPRIRVGECSTSALCLSRAPVFSAPRLLQCCST